MIQNLTEADYIERFTQKGYYELVKACYKEFLKGQDKQNHDLITAQLIVFPWIFDDKKEGSLIVECTAKYIKLPSGTLHDFGIVSLSISDEIMPDSVLDRWNEYKQLDNYTVIDYTP